MTGTIGQHIYLANGSEDRTYSGLIRPGRPLQLLFGGAGGATLFILTHHRLYPARPDP